ncbi:MAG: prepilin-type N-terminal cleavage/methylation domain-containing protein [Clostridium sp.]|uniref:prepilin-type N-terminal cleavage/methylation domain-containing protein n=1 Tax=Clostridium sp. TaxID=1506 RepID=UPI002A8802D3|nr:prepilin-type N-terminal cleavage/methylation domain-containing protein [Clostridium sp.]MDY5099662.1 prepilin-type N-terminal cleavage/methylation domain-containing protein [Clostridium sp.]
MMKNKSKKKKGFTLIEMIIVIAVMAIIAAIAVPSISGVKDSVAKKADKQSCETIERTAKMVLADKDLSSANGTYDVTFADSGDVIVKNGSKVEDDIAKELKECLADIKKPQEKDKTGFVISIRNSKVEVKVT